MTIINIKNMVCPRCITAVRAILVSMGFAVENVTLGEAVVENDLTEQQRKSLANKLQEDGFELLDDPRSCLVEQINEPRTNHKASGQCGTRQEVQHRI